MSDYFQSIAKVEFEGKDSQNPLAFKYYNPKQKVLGKTIEDHLRMAVCYWRTFNWPGNDPFGGQTFLRPWMDHQDAIHQATDKMENAFSFFEKLDIPYFCFHDVDIAPEGNNFNETELIQKKIALNLTSKFTPKLKFFFDNSFDYSDKINNILETINR